jgi:hypothetical protein
VCACVCECVCVYTRALTCANLCQGTLIAMWMMKHMRFTANECIGWLRIVRPGSVIGPQQQYLKDQEQRMWAVGASGVAGLGLGPRHSLSLSDLSAWASSCNPDLSAQLADQITKVHILKSTRYSDFTEFL